MPDAKPINASIGWRLKHEPRRRKRATESLRLNQHPVCPPPLAQRQWARALSQPLRSNSRNEFGLGIHRKWASRVLRPSK